MNGASACDLILHKVHFPPHWTVEVLVAIAPAQIPPRSSMTMFCWGEWRCLADGSSSSSVNLNLGQFPKGAPSRLFWGSGAR